MIRIVSAMFFSSSAIRTRSRPSSRSECSWGALMGRAGPVAEVGSRPADNPPYTRYTFPDIQVRAAPATALEAGQTRPQGAHQILSRRELGRPQPRVRVIRHDAEG